MTHSFLNSDGTEYFGRYDREGNVHVLTIEDGNAATRLDVDNVYPVGSHRGTRYEHPNGIVLSEADAIRLFGGADFSDGQIVESELAA